MTHTKPPMAAMLIVICQFVAANAQERSSMQAPVAIEDIRKGSLVTVRGIVVRIPDEDEFILEDETGRVEVYVGQNWVPFELGEEVTITGFIDDAPFQKEIYARSATRSDGSEIRFERGYD